MKIFQRIRKDLIILGIKPTQSNQMYSFSRKLFLGYLLLILGVVSSALFVVYSANNIMDYMQCFCTISALLSVGLCFSAIVLQKMRLFNYIESTEELINTRKHCLCAFRYNFNRIQNKS